ncbi:MAG: LysR family transcriptional regulator [Pseudomonadota bacterium]
MPERISSLRLFVRVARTGSFTQAAKEVGLSQPSVSRIVASLEKELGAELFIRSTHALKLTEAGAEYLSRLDPILASLEEANHLVRGTGELRGTLRIGSPTSYAVREIVPRLPQFLEQHPKLRIDLVMTDTFQDLIQDGIDIAFRFGRLSDSNMTARKVMTCERIIVASPDYLERVGTPQTPSDLVNHKIIKGPPSIGLAGWSFTKRGKKTSIKVSGQLSFSVNEGAIAAAVSGLGIVLSAVVGCRTELNRGQLVRLLPEWTIGTVDGHALMAGGRMTKASAKAFVDYMTDLYRNEN